MHPATGTRQARLARACCCSAPGTAYGPRRPSPAPGWPVDAPNGSDPWPTCADADAQYCIESATNNGVPASASVNVLPGTLGYNRNPSTGLYRLPLPLTATKRLSLSASGFQPPIRLLSLTDLSVSTSTMARTTPRSLSAARRRPSTGTRMPRSTMCRLSGCLNTNWATQSLVAHSATPKTCRRGAMTRSQRSAAYIATNARIRLNRRLLPTPPSSRAGRTFPLGIPGANPTSPAMGLPRTAGHSPRTFTGLHDRWGNRSIERVRGVP